MSQYRSRFIGFISLLVVAELIVITCNYTFDPLWCFGQLNRLNATSIIIDQRVQKTSLIAFGAAGYDALILGSSRTEPIKAAAFKGDKAFNYALPALYPDEYADYIRFFRDRNRQTLTRVYLGLDFFGTSSGKPVLNKAPEHYLSAVREGNFRFNALLSADPLWKYLKGYLNSDYYYRYDRRLNILVPRKMSADERKRFTEDRLNIFRDRFYSDGEYAYRPDYRKVLLDLVAENRDIEFCAFTSPVSLPLFDQLIKQGRYHDYERWLRDLVEVFGAVRNFMTINSVTANMENFYDADHFFPETGLLIAQQLTDRGRNPSLDLGELVTRENLDEYLSHFREKMKLRYGNQ